jgi:hypothetical protein
MVAVMLVIALPYERWTLHPHIQLGAGRLILISALAASPWVPDLAMFFADAGQLLLVVGAQLHTGLLGFSVGAFLFD